MNTEELIKYIYDKDRNFDEMEFVVFCVKIQSIRKRYLILWL